MGNKKVVANQNTSLAKISNKELLIKYPKDKGLILMGNDKVMLKYSPKNCMKYSNNARTIEASINSKSISIGTLHRIKGREFTEGLIMGWLSYLNDVLNLNKPMSDDQIEMCSMEIANEFYHFKFSDLTLLFKRIISGVYGEFYESISIPKVLTFFREYNEERLDIGYNLSQRDHENFKSDKTFDVSKNIKRIWNGTPSN